MSHWFVLLYGDVMLIATKSMDEINKLKLKLNMNFEVKDLSSTKKILRIEIVGDTRKDKLTISQWEYIERLTCTYDKDNQTDWWALLLSANCKLIDGISIHLWGKRVCPMFHI